MKKIAVILGITAVMVAACSSPVPPASNELTDQYGIVTVYKEPT